MAKKRKSPSRLRLELPWDEAIGRAIKKDPASIPARKTAKRGKKRS